MNRLKLIIICLLNANVNYMQQVHHYTYSRDRIWLSDEKRQDLKVNDYNTHDERLLIFCLLSEFFLPAVANFLLSGAILQNVQLTDSLFYVTR